MKANMIDRKNIRSAMTIALAFGILGSTGCVLDVGEAGEAEEVNEADGANEIPVRIKVEATGKYLHVGGDDAQLVTTRDQSDDDFTSFYIIPESDGIFRIKAKATDKFLRVDSNDGQLVTTRHQLDDDFTRFSSEDDGDGVYRIRVLATGKYLHVGSNDQLVSTGTQSDDGFTRFETDYTLPPREHKAEQVHIKTYMSEGSFRPDGRGEWDIWIDNDECSMRSNWGIECPPGDTSCEMGNGWFGSCQKKFLGCFLIWCQEEIDITYNQQFSYEDQNLNHGFAASIRKWTFGSWYLSDMSCIENCDEITP